MERRRGGSRASAAAVARVRGAAGPARSGSGSFGGGGCCCGAVPPVNRLRPRAARQLPSAEGRREPPLPSPRVAEGRGELWRLRFRVGVGGDSLGVRRAGTPVPFAWSAEAAPGGARSRLPRQAVPGRPAFLPSACPPARPRS